ncbi:hypothetical protein JXO59_09480 [candidate division KSB1 bacterium]|nr:hypothetical protein [candidate division KSB1 bacterium]
MPILIEPYRKKILQVLLLCLTASSLHFSPAACGELNADQRALHLKSFDYVWSTIRDKHWDADLGGLDWEGIRSKYRPLMANAENESAVYQYFEEMLLKLGKTHYSLIPPELYGDLAGALNGPTSDGETGIEVAILDSIALVERIHPGSSAETCGIRPGWVIEKIGRDTVAAGLGRIAAKYADKVWMRGVQAGVVEARLAGAVGDSVRVILQDSLGAEISKTILFAPRRGVPFAFGHLPKTHVWIKVDTVADGVGYIAFNAFLAPTEIVPKIFQAIRDFMPFDGIIFDLRGNGGGMGEICMGIAAWLLPQPSYLGEMITRETQLKFTVHPRPVTYRGRVAVLVDEQSACAAEIFAEGLRSHSRAQIFGRPTAGAALAAVIERLPNGLGFQYPFANYITRNGEEIEGRGLIPDEIVSTDRELLLQGRDPVMEAAIDWIKNGGLKK